MSADGPFDNHSSFFVATLYVMSNSFVATWLGSLIGA